MSQQPTSYDNLPYGRLLDALKISDPIERTKAARRELELVLKALEGSSRKKRGQQRPDVDAKVVAILRPMWEAVIDHGDLLRLSMDQLKKLKSGQTIGLKPIPIQVEGKTVLVQPNEQRITLTSQVLRVVKKWKGLRFKEDVVRKVQVALGEHPARAKRRRELEEEFERLRSKNSHAYRTRINEVQRKIAELESTPVYRNEDRLAGYVREAAIRYLLSLGLTWWEMPPCLVDHRQTWLGKNNIPHFYNRQKVLLKYDGSYTRKEFESRHEAFLSILKDPTN